MRYRWDKKDGLPDWNISCFMQDSQGLLWIAFSTSNELFTFDGYRFRAVQSVNALKKSRIVRLAEDRQHNIWMVRETGSTATIDVLNPATDEVSPLHTYLSLPHPVQIPIDNVVIFYNVAGRIWVGSLKKAYYYDGSWKKVFEDRSGGKLWYPAPGGLFWYEKADRLYLCDGHAAVLDSFPNQGFVLRRPWLDSDLNLWAAYSKPGQTTIDHYYRLRPRNRGIAANYTRKAPGTDWLNDQDHFSRAFNRSKFISRGFLMTQTPEGWHLGLPDSPRLVNFSRRYPDSEDMKVFYFDRSDGFWTNNTNGLSRFALKAGKTPFKTLLKDHTPVHSIRGMVKKDRQLYVLSHGGSVRVDMADGKASPLLFPYNDLGYFLLPEGDLLWIGTQEKVVAVQVGGEANVYPIQDGQLPTYALHRSPSMGLLAGTGKGLYRLNPRSGVFERTLFLDHEIFSFHENQDGLWVGTADGLILLDARFRIRRKALQRGVHPVSIRPEHIYEDSDGRFWIASRGAGLLHWDPQTDALRVYDASTGMPHDNIHAVYPDGYGYLWLPSDGGLIRFHKRSGYIQTFYKKDGLADDEFNSFAHFRDKDGTLFFGGINGITFFHPKDVPAYTGNRQPLTLVEASTFNLRTGASSFQVKNASGVKPLVLKPRNTHLDLDVSPFVYEADPSIQYAWKIEGFNRDWVRQTSPRIRLYNLPYGKHTLQVRYHRFGDTWPGPVLELPVQVLRPFYLRWPFFLLVALCITGIARAYSYRRNRQLRSAKLQLEAEVQRRTLQVEENIQVISRQAQELRSLDELKSRFFANVTHELRTPLTLIIGPVERLLQKTEPPEKTNENLHIVHRNAQKLLDLVEELLDLSKLESQKLVLDERPLHFYSFITRLFGSFAPYAEHRKVRFIFHYDCQHDLMIWADAPKLEKIISNLLSNALKFTPSNGRITLSVFKEGEALHIRVEDTGRGIPPEDLPYIFDRYFQSKRPDAPLQGGTGIGLSLSREYARLLGGELNVKSVVGQGSMFSFHFPVKYPPAAFREENPLVESAADPSRIGGKPLRSKVPTLLIVEDDYDLIRYIRSILEEEYNTLIADNGASALRQLSEYSVDLILSDVMMPEMDGFQLLEAVRAQGSDIPFIFLTARMDRDDRMQALRIGVDDYLTKPFLEEELQVRLRNLLERQAVRRAMANAPEEERGEEDAIPSYDRQWFARLEAVMEENISNPDFNVNQMAVCMNLSVRAVQYRIRTLTGMSPVNYLTEFRLNRARQLIEARSYQTVAEVCFAVGYRTPRYFTEIFKTRYGKSPSEF